MICLVYHIKFISMVNLARAYSLTLDRAFKDETKNWRFQPSIQIIQIKRNVQLCLWHTPFFVS